MIQGLLQTVFVQNQTKSPFGAILKTHSDDKGFEHPNDSKTIQKGMTE
jgi:hypothetical protein